MAGPPQAPAPEALNRAKQAAELLDDPSEPNAIRFLAQATFGPRLANGVSPAPIDSVEHVVDVGISQSITEQLSAPRSTARR
ncbi:hypothetical protein NR800_03875 [Corallococcus interemptor]|uniref:hypothetical protein n=1 Tax=Corallococcus TaxID=83461 RepID=UPI001CBF13C1|nr:hypothetical protein [Corallococcus sp. AS-1-12]MBZ4336554.1 hypothetical protein [Corallococcus sp. AS-1-12]